MHVHIEIPRLLIREIIPADEEGMFAMDADPEVHRYLGNNSVKTIESAREMIAFIRRQYIDYGIGRWAVTDKQSGDFMGWTGFRFMTETINNHTGYYDFGYRFIKKYWGKGFATESAQAALDFGVKELKLKNIYAMTDVGNLASMHVLEKIGLKYSGTFPYDADSVWRKKGDQTSWFVLNDE